MQLACSYNDACESFYALLLLLVQHEETVYDETSLSSQTNHEMMSGDVNICKTQAINEMERWILVMDFSKFTRKLILVE